MLNLSELKPKQKGIIADLNTSDKNILKKLMSMGILPGLPLEVVQTFPSYVFKVGYTQVAVDKTIAEAILVTL